MPGTGSLALRSGRLACWLARFEGHQGPDVIIAALSLLVVIAASVTMERAAAALGNRFAIPEIVVGGLVLAAVTSLPNAVAAVYLAARGGAGPRCGKFRREQQQEDSAGVSPGAGAQAEDGELGQGERRCPGQAQGDVAP